MSKEYVYRRVVPIDLWNKHIEADTLIRLVETIGWEGLDAAIKSIVGGKEFKDVRIDVTPDFSDDPQFREVVVTVEYEPIV